MKKKRRYNTRRVSLKISYSVQEVAELFSIHKNAVLMWIRAGLKIIDLKKPYLINGRDLSDFLNNKQKKRKHKCKPDEFFCFKCRLPRKPIPSSISITPRNLHRLKISAKCEICRTSMFKEGSTKKLVEFEKIFSLLLQPLEHIIGCNKVSLNSDTNGDDQHESIQR